MRLIGKPFVLQLVAIFVLTILISQEAAAGSSGAPAAFFGLPHIAAGQALLSRTPDGGLAVSNLGSSGQDGVTITLGEVQGFLPEVTLPGPALPQGAVLLAAAGGPVGGSSGDRLAQGRRNSGRQPAHPGLQRDRGADL
jgi:hypothetical protein